MILHIMSFHIKSYYIISYCIILKLVFKYHIVYLYIYIYIYVQSLQMKEKMLVAFEGKTNKITVKHNKQSKPVGFGGVSYMVTYIYNFPYS